MEKVSIIIPCRRIDEMTKKCIAECLRLDYPDFEILVLPDDTAKKSKDKRLRIINTGKVKPAFKRNLGMQRAKGKFFAFIDSDAYPEKEWLKNAVKYFEDDDVGVAGGPNLTPAEGNFWEKVSGYVLGNFLASGNAYVRYKKARNQFVKELPSCNYLSRREISPKYDASFLTAEDSKFCFTIARKGYKILYAKDVVVYHHRRDSLGKHVKQIWIYGRDIAWAIKEEFSVDKVYYFILSLFVIGFVGGVALSFFNSLIRAVFLIFLSFYLLVILITSVHENFKMSFWIFIATILTHFAYGFGFLYGLNFEKKI